MGGNRKIDSDGFALEGFSESINDKVSEMGIKLNIIESSVVKTKFLENTRTILKEHSQYSEIVNL